LSLYSFSIIWNWKVNFFPPILHNLRVFSSFHGDNDSNQVRQETPVEHRYFGKRVSWTGLLHVSWTVTDESRLTGGRPAFLTYRHISFHSSPSFIVILSNYGFYDDKSYQTASAEAFSSIYINIAKAWDCPSVCPLVSIRERLDGFW
jgi:hypothetical protein